MLTVPPLVGGLAAFPLWLRSETIFGNLAGTAVIFGTGVALILRESAALDALVQMCREAGYAVCTPEPAAFTRFAIYAFIALIEVFLLFTASLTVEHRIRRRSYAPEWR